MMIFEMLHLYTTCTVISMKAFTETSTKTIFITIILLHVTCKTIIFVFNGEI